MISGGDIMNRRYFQKKKKSSKIIDISIYDDK